MQHEKMLVKNSIEKAEEALSAAQNNMKFSLRTAQNRNYYAVFYIVLALAYLDGFQTGKHHQLMGWFNREYIYQNKIFDSKLNEIYRILISNREKFDYDVSEEPIAVDVEKDFQRAKFFVETVKEYIIKKMD